ncbi:hypothetical protein F4825DRAFT_445647 [Nemania diffusa]|nr:hypothetical protein F4825DRAFT_445647 [Nemania diffusa]
MPQVRDLLNERPTNYINNPLYTSHTNKAWAANYPPIETRYFRVHTIPDQDGGVSADFDSPLLPLYADEAKRMNEPAERPNVRAWRFETESDIENWWHTEISSVALAGFARYPQVIQTSHTKPLGTANVLENVDSTYAVYMNDIRVAQVIIEAKRNLIIADEWQDGNLSGPQQRLAKELRGYADKYESTLVGCVDGSHYLQLQFRAHQASDIRDADCLVDCWVFPIWQSRYAFYRMLVQGWRRCQGLAAPKLTVGSLTEYQREYYTGRPVWKVPSHSGSSSKVIATHPEGYVRMVDAETGALGWVHERVEGIIWETGGW